MSFVGIAREADDHAASVGLPIWSLKAGKCGYKINSAVVVGSAGQRFDFGAGLDEAEIVSNPLHQCAGNCDAALESIAWLFVPKSVSYRGEQPVLRENSFRAGVEEQKASGAIGILCLAGIEAGLAY